ncbi:unnamed protein product [Haemonchus placei]|uniref:HTH_48 domain-containing protein n=1 Tax=Haemonchus placei TaxID=6290 RepID=A0A0N4WGG7_HAEPC|nr:unnamed protein product [Haemonchus placei]
MTSPQLEEVNICPEEGGPSHVVEEGSEQVIKDEQLHKRSVPPTQRAPFIQRANLCITANVRGGPQCRGCLTVHYVFTDAPDKKLLFAHEYDTLNRNEEEGVQKYFVQKYPVLQRSIGRFGVPVGVRSSFAEAVLSFYKFLQLSIGVGAGRSRHDVVEYAIRRAEYEVKRANDEKKEIITFRDIAENRAQKFRSGDGSLKDEERVGRPSLVDHYVLLRAVEKDRRQPLREIEKKVGVSHTVVAAHLKLLEMVKKLDNYANDLLSARATTTRTMDEEGQEEEIRQSGALAAAKAQFHQREEAGEREREEAKKRVRYSCQLPEIADPANVLDLR